MQDEQFLEAMTARAYDHVMAAKYTYESFVRWVERVLEPRAQAGLSRRPTERVLTALVESGGVHREPVARPLKTLLQHYAWAASTGVRHPAGRHRPWADCAGICCCDPVGP